jgi:O-antigen/teichoic acid export membrane protein
MTKSVSLKKNVIANALRTMMGFVFPLVTFPYVSRVLGPEGVGRYNFASSVVAYFGVLAAIGIPFYGTREVARHRDDKEKLRSTALELLSINAIAAALSYALLFTLVALVPQFRREALLIAVLSSTIAFSAIGMDWLFQGLEQYVFIAVRSFVFQALSLGLLFVAVRKPGDVLPYAALSVLASVGANLVNFATAFRHFGRGGRARLELRRHLKPILTMFGMNAAISVYTSVNTVMLGFFSGAASVGYYATAMKLVSMVLGMVASASGVLMPRSSYYVRNGRMGDFEALVGKAFRLLLLIGLPSVVGLVGLRKEIIGLFAGPSFTPAAAVLAVTSLNILVIGISNIFGIQILIPVGKERATFHSVLLGAGVNLLLNFLLMPPLAELGAAISIVVTEAAIALYQAFFCAPHLRRFLSDWKKTLPYLIGSALIALLLLLCGALVPSPGPRLAIAIPASVLLYGLVLVLARDEFLEMLRGRFAAGPKGLK